MMIEITQFNLDTHQWEVVDGIKPDYPVSFQIGIHRYDVRANEDGTLNIYHISSFGNDDLSIVPESNNVINIKPSEQR